MEGNDLVSKEDLGNLNFQTLRQTEMHGLIRSKVWKKAKRNNVPKGMLIYETRWVDVIKKTNREGTKIPKSRFVAKHFRDHQLKHVPIISPIISKFGQCITLCWDSPDTKAVWFIKDVTQAYTQIKIMLDRLVFLTPPPEMELSKECFLRPLYGIPEYYFHWFITYRDPHTRSPKMYTCTTDQCILYRKVKENSHKIPK